MYYLREEIFAAGRPCPQCHAATLCELPGGELMAAWYAGSYEGARDVAIYAARKTSDGGWTEPEVIADTPGFAEGNPALYRDVSGVLWLFYVTMVGERWDTCQVKYQRSVDSGRTWDIPVLLRAEWGWMTSNKPLTLPDGAILLPLYEERGAAFTLRSDDVGRHWDRSDPIETPEGVIQPALARLSDGRLLMLLRTLERENGALWQSFSDDEGRTWSAPTRTRLPNPNARVDVQSLASGALVLAFNDTPRGRTPLTLALSDDDGRTWPLRVNVETDEAEFSYPALIQSSDGLCHLAYSHRRVNIAHVAFDEEWLRAQRKRKGRRPTGAR